jgi:hypothetical protein
MFVVPGMAPHFMDIGITPVSHDCHPFFLIFLERLVDDAAEIEAGMR